MLEGNFGESLFHALRCINKMDWEPFLLGYKAIA
jgi:hypothetical protein